MTSILGKIFGDRWVQVAPGPNRGDEAYARAMNLSEDLLDKMQNYSRSTDAARAVMADIWAQRHNVPYMTTTVQVAQELNAAVYQDPKAAPSPKIQEPR